MVPWAFFDYVLPDDSCPIDAWYGEQDLEVRAALDFTIHQLRVIDDWLDEDVKQFDLLTRKHAGLGELRFWTEKTKSRAERSFRVAGLYQPEQRRFILFTGAEKWLRGLVYVPRNAFDVALKYKRALEAGEGTIRVHT